MNKYKHLDIQYANLAQTESYKLLISKFLYFKINTVSAALEYTCWKKIKLLGK